MPGMSGAQTISFVKQMKPLVRVIMLAGHVTIQSGIEDLKLGAYMYLLKPTETNEMIARIKKAYRQKRPSVWRLLRITVLRAATPGPPRLTVDLKDHRTSCQTP